jgi:hypothetical protein
MRVEQEVSLVIKSTSLSPDEITNRVGLDPDESVRMGSRLSIDGQPRPKSHLWIMRSGLPNVDVEAQICTLIDRVGDHADRIGSLSDATTANFMQVVRRYFPDPEEAELGFFLSTEIVSFLSATRSGFDFDEYDYGAPSSR